jgi:hypothetical protein
MSWSQCVVEQRLIEDLTGQIKRKKQGGAESEKVFNPGDVVEQSRSRTILFFTGDWEVIAKEALSLFVSMLIPPSEVSRIYTKHTRHTQRQVRVT